MAEDNRIFGDNEEVRNAFFNALGDVGTHQRTKNEIVRLTGEFLTYEDDSQKQAQFKEAHPEWLDYCNAVQRYWWGEDGDRLKYRKMTYPQKVRYKKRIIALPDRDIKIELRWAIFHENIQLDREFEERQRRA
ncbi:MAG: hypothetical protein OXB93_03925 [Cytophagales bacterium]|nr:hypothetical protein [Cytophagales bacterium]